MALGFALLMVWFLWIKNITAPFLETIPPIFSLILFQLGIFGALMLVTSVFQSNKIRFKVAIIGVLIALGLSIITAPYLVDSSGYIDTSVDYWFVSSDAAIASTYAYFMPDWSIWFMTYIVSPFLFVFVLPTLISSPKAIAKILGGRR